MTRILILFVILFSQSLPAKGSSINFWNEPKRGTNFFNQAESKDRFAAAKAYGIQFVRLTPNKWQTSERDFLIGNADQFNGLVEADFNALKKILDEAQEVGIKVLLTTLSTPGCRWAQQNGNQYDKRLWRDREYHSQTAQFWKELATRLKGHPALVGYDVINEPAPERAAGFSDWYTGDYTSWYSSVENTPADLNLFYKTVTEAIRSVDNEVPIIVETGFYATTWAFKYLKPIADEKVFYSFHMYEPYAYTNYQQSGQYVYPGRVPIGEGDTPPSLDWNKTELSKFFDPIRNWMSTNNISSNRIIVGEFGVYRQHSGADRYLADLIDIFKAEKWHWTVYSFREDTWPGMDYELGSQTLSAEWWEAFERGENPPRPYVQNLLFDAILRGIRN